MRAPLIFLISVFLFVKSSAQNGDYLIYHNYINLAETHLVNNNPDSSFVYYDKAFGEYKFIFAKDAVIAAQFAWKQKNKDKAIEYLLKGARNGLRSRCLDLIPIMKSFTDSRFYLAVYDSMAAANEVYRSSLDPLLSDEWTNRQDAIVLSLSNNELGDFMEAVKKNVERIKELIAKGKFPGEKYIGIGEDCEKLGNQSVFYSLANYDCIVSEMHDALWNAVKRGDLHPREFAAIWEWEFVKSAQKMDYVTQPFVRATAKNFARIYVKDNVYVIINRECNKSKQKVKRFGVLLEADDITTEEYNKSRALYYITSVETDQKKKQLETTDGYRFFFGNK